MESPSHPGMYDTIGRLYRRHRRPDPRIQAAVDRALGSARRICNVGAGAGSYEPADRDVVAVEPSRTMLAQRPAGAVVRAVAEALPFVDDSFDAALAVLTVHHWQDQARGLAEMRRVAGRCVVLGFDKSHTDLWMVQDYVPEILEFDSSRSWPSVADVVEGLGGARVEVLPVPHDCTDGFQAAYWRRPERYLDPEVRSCISSLALLDPALVEAAMERLAADLASGAWAARHGHLLERTEMDYGYRLIIAE